MQRITPLSPSAQASPKERLQFDVHCLAGEIGARNIDHYSSLCRAAEHIEAALRDAGYTPTRQTFHSAGKCFANIVAEKYGEKISDDVVLIGAHYDTHKVSPGANDNASGVAVMLELARTFSLLRPKNTLRFVAFTNEESPFTRTRHMGSYVYARACRERGDKIVGMLCLETLGSYSEELGSQGLSLGGLLLPRRANFLALVGNLKSRPFLHLCSEAMRRESAIRTRTISLPGQLPGVRSSDHWSFWKCGFPAIMVTDTAPLRYVHYHRKSDTPDKINYDWLESVLEGLLPVVRAAVG